MRRPVKPFVTEYRGGVRRQGPPGQKSDPLKGEPDGGEPRVSEARAPAWPQSAAPEDGYEAALRAADALFSGGRTPAAPDDAATDATSAEAQPGTGRVLRVLDEAPSPEMARLEAEFAPKRRGRKPGSKNKPKITALVDDAPRTVPTWASEVREVPAARTQPAVSQPAISQPAMPQPTIAAPMVRPAMKHPVANAVPLAALSADATAPRGERYAWVRTRLKPGEQWKRRLPKVAW